MHGRARPGADVYSADINSLYLLRRGKLLETDVSLEAAVRQSDVIVTGACAAASTPVRAGTAAGR